MGETKRRNKAAWRAYVASLYPNRRPGEAVRLERLWPLNTLLIRHGIPGQMSLLEAAIQTRAAINPVFESREDHIREARRCLEIARRVRLQRHSEQGLLLGGMEDGP